MSTAWYIAFGLLATAVCVLALLVLGILRRSLETLSRVNAYLEVGEAERLDVSLPLIGSPAPALATTVPIPGDFTVTFLEYECESCRVLAVALARKPVRTDTGSHVLVVDALVREFMKIAWAGEVITDAGRLAFDRWGVVATPTTYYVDSHGLVVAGLHPNSADDIGGLRKKAIAGQDAVELVRSHDHHHDMTTQQGLSASQAQHGAQ